jgi:ketosteroid isomerase-like protein
MKGVSPQTDGNVVTSGLAGHDHVTDNAGKGRSRMPVWLRGRSHNQWLRGGLALVAMLAPVCAGALSASQRVESDQDVLVALERGWNEAFYRRDVAFIENLLAEEFVATYDDGRQGDKATELALVREFNQRVESAVPDEFRVRVYRDTAVVWFTLRIVGIREGQRSEMALRYTDVWVVRDGRWQCVSSQSTRVAAR